MPPTIRRSTVPFVRHQDAAAELFSRLRAAAGGVPCGFLDSSDHLSTPAPARSRYSVLAFSLGPQAQSVRLTDSAFDWIAQHVWGAGTHALDDDAVHHHRPEEPAFQLGWVGWVGYENQAQLFRATHAVVIDHHRHRAQLQTLGEDPDWVERVRNEIRQLGDVSLGAASQLHQLQVRDSRREYMAKIRAAKEQIRRGNSYEVCLTTAVTGELSGDPWEAYLRLRAHNRAPFTQFLNFPAAEEETTEVTILSTSPERFVEITPAGVIRSEPIKGTRARAATPEDDDAQRADLLSHPKDRAENVMIADLVRNDLSIHAVPGSLRTERLCAVETYPTVHQMVSSISAQLEPGTSRAKAVSDAFPPGSMTGAPKISTMSILRHLETASRGPYSGAAGYFSTTGACDLSVLIRAAVLSRSAADGPDSSRAWDFHLGVGGAITADSEPEAEWAEIVTKSRGVLGALGAVFPGCR